MRDPERIVDLADSLSRWCQESVKGSGITFRCNEVDLAAEEAFAADKLFPVFLHVVMMRPPIDPDLRVIQCTNPDYMFAIQPVVPSPPCSGIEEKWESRLQPLIASFKEQAGASAGLVDVTDEGLDYAICSSWNDVPTFDSVEAAMNHYVEEAIGK